MQVNIKLLYYWATMPTYATDGSGCFDISTTTSGTIAPNDSKVFDTGLAFEIPEGHVMLVFSRSGHGFKHDTRLANCVGIIDSDFRGELKIKLRNDGDTPLTVESGDRIAQGMIIPVPTVRFNPVDELSDTARGAGGFGSTGV